MLALLVLAAVIDLVAALYLALIAPIMITGWNNTHFDGGIAALVAVGLMALLGGPLAAFITRQRKAALALALAGVPALAALGLGIFALTAE